MALAHGIGDKVEAACQRGDLFEKRRKMMEDRVAYPCRTEKVAKVRPIGVTARRK